eukprot:15996147-Heterocapsa_arctica.AAC.1
MSINITHVGRALVASSRLPPLQPTAGADALPSELPSEDKIMHVEWVDRQRACRQGPTGASGYTVCEWVEAVRAARRAHE